MGSMTYFDIFPTSLGACGIAWRGNLVVATRLPDTTPEVTATYLAARAQRHEPPPVIHEAMTSITTLLNGEQTDLSHIECDFDQVDPFALKVYTITRDIPAGETLTYGDVASELGDKQLAREVGKVLGRNPLPIIVPCHRVIGANYKLTGFSAPGGIETKRRMLQIEGAMLGESLGLFDPVPVDK